MGTGMLRIFISILLLLSFVSTGICSALPVRSCKKPCQKIKIIDSCADPLNTRSCNIMPCQSAGERVFTLPDSQSQPDRESKNKFLPLEPGIPGITSLPLPYRSQSGNYITGFHNSGQPPFYLLNCSLIC